MTGPLAPAGPASWRSSRGEWVLPTLERCAECVLAGDADAAAARPAAAATRLAAAATAAPGAAGAARRAVTAGELSVTAVGRTTTPVTARPATAAAAPSRHTARRTRVLARSSSCCRAAIVSDQWLRCAGKHGTRGVTTRLAGPLRPGRPARSAEPVTPAAPGPVEPVTPAAPVPGRARHASAPRAVEQALLEQPGESAIGQRLAASLAGWAVLERGVREGNLAYGVAADRAGLARPAVHAQARLLLRLELTGSQP